jgi:hypothetical protein
VSVLLWLCDIRVPAGKPVLRTFLKEIDVKLVPLFSLEKESV